MPLFLGSHWWPLWIFPLCTAFGLSLVWLWRGRDARATSEPKSTWLPPLELSPAQVATLIDESCDLRDIVATLVDLAARGYLTIEEAHAEELVLSKGDLRFTRCDNAPPIERLRRHERLFLNALFDPQPPDIAPGRRPANCAPSDDLWNETALSRLKNKFYRHLPPIRNEIYRSLMAGGFFFSDPQATSAFFLMVGSFILIGGFNVLRFDLNLPDMGLSNGLLSFPLGVMLSGAIWWASARFMPARTALGTLKTEEIRHFMAWVRTVEPPTLRALLAKDPSLFERLLPYAIVLGVGPIWAQKCDACGQWAPCGFATTRSKPRAPPVQLVA